MGLYLFINIIWVKNLICYFFKRNIELSELIAYFKNGYGPFQSLFESLSSIHKSISSALNSSYDVCFTGTKNC